MPDSTPLAQRIKAEFDSRAARAQTAEQERAKEAQTRDAGLARFSKVCDELRGVWKPRLEEFAKQFGDKVKMTPVVEPSHREAKINFMTDMANVTLTLAVAASSDVAKLVIDYDLLIIPVYFEYDRHARLEMPLDNVDKAAVGKWIDDQLVTCVKTYLSLQDNELYIKRALVEDPITKTRLLKNDAKATLEHEGKTLYFASEENLRQYKQKLQIK